LPAETITYKNMRFPTMPQSELDQAVRWEARQRLTRADEPITVQYIDAGAVFQGDERRREVVVMAAETAALEQHLQCLKQAGFKPLAIDAPPAALPRCVDAMNHDPHADATQVILDVGAHTSKVLIARRGYVRFFKLIDIGGQRLTEAVADHLGLDASEALDLRRQLIYPPTTGDGPAAHASESARIQRPVYEAIRPVIDELGRELGLCLRYYSVTFRGRRPEQVALVGGEARQDWLAPMLADAAGVAVTTIDPIDEVRHSQAKQTFDAGPNAEWAVAAGLSLRGQMPVQQVEGQAA
jgi:type IV pilus assembly protein PilM